MCKIVCTNPSIEKNKLLEFTVPLTPVLECTMTKEFELSTTHLVMKFVVGEDAMMLYTYVPAISHLQGVLDANALLGNFLSPDEILVKMSYDIIGDLFCTSDNGVTNSAWVGKKVVVFPSEKADFEIKFRSWHTQLVQLVGSDNVGIVHLHKEILEAMAHDLKQRYGSHSDEYNLRYMANLELYRLNTTLNDHLAVKGDEARKPKL